MYLQYTKKAIALSMCLVGSTLLGYAGVGFANPFGAQKNIKAVERNPNWDNRLGPGGIMQEATTWLSQQHKRLRVRFISDK